jgi:hypothetical protein
MVTACISLSIHRGQGAGLCGLSSKGQKNKKGAPLRTDFGLGGADIVTINQARERALEYRRMAKQGLNPRFNARQEVPTFEEVAQQVHIDRMPTWKNAKHG